MRTLILLFCVWLASAGTVPDKCDRVTFDGKYYNRELLRTARLASSFSYAKSSNTLFFSYKKPTNFTEDWGVAYYNIDTAELKDIPEVAIGLPTAINPETDEVYLGSNNGIYKFNPQSKEVEPYTADGVRVYYLYFDKILFYITLPIHEIYNYDGEETKKVSNSSTVYAFIGDKEQYYFANGTGLYRVLDDKEETAEKFADADGYKTVFARDNDKNIFVGRRDGVYTPNTQDKKLDKVVDFEHVFGLAFDKDNNIIISDYDNIYKLTLNQAKCPPA